MKIWRCPKCNDGVRAPARMRRENALRYCLKCTAKEGKLVQRICPSIQAERVRLAEAAKLAEQKKKEMRAEAREIYYKTERGWLDWHCGKWAGLRAFSAIGEKFKGLKQLTMYSVRLARPKKQVTMERREDPLKPDGLPGNVYYDEVTRTYPRQSWSTGRAYYYQNRFVITAGSDPVDALTVILHELAHLASPERGHGPAWKVVFADAVEEVTGVRPFSTGDKFEYHKACQEVMRKWYMTYEKKLTPSTASPTVEV